MGGGGVEVGLKGSRKEKQRIVGSELTHAHLGFSVVGAIGGHGDGEPWLGVTHFKPQIHSLLLSTTKKGAASRHLSWVPLLV